MQHRGEEGAGVVVSDGSSLNSFREMGHVSNLSTEKLRSMNGHAAIGHVRYSTTGSSVFSNVQPLFANLPGGKIAVAHNGNLTNSKEIHDRLERTGSIFQTSNDSETILHLLAQPGYRDPKNRLQKALGELEGAFSFVFLNPDALYAARDWHGYRPLTLGKLEDSWVVASETTAYDLIRAKYVREIEPGEVLRIDKDGLTSSRIESEDPGKRAHCIFEHVYFARPDSLVFEKLVYNSRLESGKCLAREAPVDADIVVPVPDSGVVSAIGYSRESGLPLEMGFIRNHYIGRTFILPDQSDREAKVRLKLNVVPRILKGKRVVVVDDSIIRGNTSRSRVKFLRDAGAKEIHVRIACPPTRFPCYYGIDFPDPEQLIAHTSSIDEICRVIGADSLAYLSEDGLLDAVGGTRNTFCTACFSGNYAAKPKGGITKNQLE
ncbi:MAG: amidophosphoribosyltransferase [Planctomycetota bacterium]|nr:amidophosphoribosyltransferase [Planctomycetota bacterium]